MPGPSRQLRRMQWVAIILVTAAIALNYMDRSTLAIGNLKIREEFGINATAIGALGSAWALTYGLAQLPSGYLLDRIGPKFLVGAAMVAVVAVPGRRRPRQHLFPADAVAHRPRRHRGAMLSVRDPLGQRLVRRQGPRNAQRRVYFGGLYRPNAGAADLDRADARVQLAGDVHRHGPRRGRRRGFVWFMIYRDPRAQVLQPQDEEYLRANRAGQVLGLAAPMAVAVSLPRHVGLDARGRSAPAILPGCTRPGCRPIWKCSSISALPRPASWPRCR